MELCTILSLHSPSLPSLLLSVPSAVCFRNPLFTWITTHLSTQKDERLSWPCWLTHSGQFTHKVVTCPTISQTQVRESSSIKDQRSNFAANVNAQVKVNVKRTCIAPFVKLQLKALRYGSHRVDPANYTIPASTLRTFARWRHLNGRHLIQLATHLSTPEG